MGLLSRDGINILDNTVEEISVLFWQLIICMVFWYYIMLLQSLLCDPNPNSPANSEAARMFGENKRDYNRKVREIVEQSWTADWLIVTRALSLVQQTAETLSASSSTLCQFSNLFANFSSGEYMLLPVPLLLDFFLFYFGTITTWSLCTLSAWCKLEFCFKICLQS